MRSPLQAVPLLSAAPWVCLPRTLTPFLVTQGLRGTYRCPSVTLPFVAGARLAVKPQAHPNLPSTKVPASTPFYFPSSYYR